MECFEILPKNVKRRLYRRWSNCYGESFAWTVGSSNCNSIIYEACKHVIRTRERSLTLRPSEKVFDKQYKQKLFYKHNNA